MRIVFLVGVALSMAGCGSPSTDDWLKQIKDDDVVKRRQAIRELGSRPGDAPRIVPALAEALSDASSFVRRDAALALAKFGLDAQPAAPALTLALKDKDASVRSAAKSALKVVTPHAGIR